MISAIGVQLDLDALKKKVTVLLTHLPSTRLPARAIASLIN